MHLRFSYVETLLMPLTSNKLSCDGSEVNGIHPTGQVEIERKRQMQESRHSFPIVFDLTQLTKSRNETRLDQLSHVMQ